MTPYQMQTDAIKTAILTLDAARLSAISRDDAEDAELFNTAIDKLKSAFKL